MGAQLAADLILILHLLFILFVLFGGLLCMHRTRWAWLHLPAMAWGIWVEWTNRICPLTPLENHFRKLASGQGYREGFTEHYLIPLIYPEQLTNPQQYFLGILVLVINMIIYFYILRKWQKKQRQVDE
jgi:hypothetical protein